MDPREFDTERLVLRVPTLDDFEESAAMWSDETVVRHIGGRPFTREESWQGGPKSAPGPGASR